MKNNSVKFNLERYPMFIRIFTHAFTTNINLCDDEPVLTEVKSDYISEVIMFEIFPVDLKQLFIRAKNVIERS